MLLDFSVSNYLSFRDPATFSMLGAKSVKEHEGEDPLRSNTVSLQDENLKVLKFAAVYGANGAGKSNLIKSIAGMRRAVLRSFVDEYCIKRLCEDAYKLDAAFDDQPSSFEIKFFFNDNIYRYGFEFKDSVVVSEWLFKKEKGSSREKYLFKRDGNEIRVNSKVYKGARGLESKTRNNALFLSTCFQFNVSEAGIVRTWFNDKLQVADAQPHLTAETFLEDPDIQRSVLDFIGRLDKGVKNITIDLRALTSAESLWERVRMGRPIMGRQSKDGGFQELKILFEHERLRKDGKKEMVPFLFDAESEGTKKVFGYAGPWFQALRQGATLLVDEFGASLHSMLAMELIRLFQHALNTDAQLIVATHDTNLLRKELLRRDQIWFVEKQDLGATDLYSLVEYKINQARAVRNDASYGKDYLQGRYGAIPFFGDLQQFLKEFLKDGSR